MNKKKMLIFQPALRNSRIDYLNFLSEIFDLVVVFLFDQLRVNNFDQHKIINQCDFEIIYLLKGPRCRECVFRFGMYSLIKRIKPEIIVGYSYSLTTQYLIILKKLGILNQKIGSTLDDSIDICYSRQSKTRFIVMKKFLERLDFLVVVSREIAEFYRDNCHMNNRQIVVSPILQVPARLRAHNVLIESIASQYMKGYNLTGKKVLLFAGELTPEKNMPGYLKTIYPLLLGDPKLIFIIVGEGKELNSLKRIVEDNRLQRKVLFAGAYEGEKLHAWYLCGSGFVLPGVNDPYETEVSEALIFGLHVLCSVNAGAYRLIKPENGLIFNPSDKVDTIVKTNRFFESIKPVDNISLAGRPSLIDFNRLEIYNEWEKLEYD